MAVVGASGLAKARVALFKGLLILGAALAVGLQIAWRWFHPELPLFEGMGVAALLNLGANLVCLKLLMPYRSGDINLASAWECSRNDVYEGLAVLAAALHWASGCLARAGLIWLLRGRYCCCSFVRHGVFFVRRGT